VDPDAPAVSVTVPAAPGYVHVLRTVTAGVAARVGWRLDAIDDLRLAVDEAAARVLAAGPASELRLQIIRDGARVGIVVGSNANPGAWPPNDPANALSLEILSALAADVAFEVVDGGPVARFTAGDSA
jgi:serine/threonine-protein kinase RsbW